MWTRRGLTETQLWAYELVDQCIREAVAANQHNGEVAVKAAILTRLDVESQKATGWYAVALKSVSRIECYIGDNETVGTGEMHVHVHTLMVPA